MQNNDCRIERLNSTPRDDYFVTLTLNSRVWLNRLAWLVRLVFNFCSLLKSLRPNRVGGFFVSAYQAVPQQSGNRMRVFINSNN